MAKATEKPNITPDIILELTYEEAQALRDLIGWKVSGATSGRRKLLSSIYNTLVDDVNISSSGTQDMVGNINFV